MIMFALAAAVVAILALFDVGTQTTMLWFWLCFIALHFAFGWWPFAGNPLPVRQQQAQ